MRSSPTDLLLSFLRSLFSSLDGADFPTLVLTEEDVRFEWPISIVPILGTKTYFVSLWV